MGDVRSGNFRLPILGANAALRHFAVPKGLPDPSAATTWARELIGVSKKLLTSTVIDAVVAKVHSGELRTPRICASCELSADPAPASILSKEGDLETASLRVSAPAKKDRGLFGELDASVEAIKRVPWTVLEEMQVNGND